MFNVYPTQVPLPIVGYKAFSRRENTYTQTYMGANIGGIPQITAPIIVGKTVQLQANTDVSLGPPVVGYKTFTWGNDFVIAY